MSRPYLVGETGWPYTLASLYIIAYWPSVLVVESSGLQASGHVCMAHGMHARRDTRCAHIHIAHA